VEVNLLRADCRAARQDGRWRRRPRLPSTKLFSTEIHKATKKVNQALSRRNVSLTEAQEPKPLRAANRQSQRIAHPTKLVGPRHNPSRSQGELLAAQVGAVELVNNSLTRQTSPRYLCPQRAMPADALAVPRAYRRVLGGVADEFLSFVGDAPLVVHMPALTSSFSTPS